ncbi:hypothetical protein AUC70_02010 [Methyloceanibacter stevinii]|uniref:Uncharacterized protein n=1 Tax=Methyloceanibacter stevinii TaxID=1774970 RepID=A0A1E3VRX0_9HYPH|nr:hypothetical protein AUC70_02010 [Methyloceanibacter stevinii]
MSLAGGFTAANSAERKGSTPLPSLDVPSAKNTTWSPASSRSRISFAFVPVCVRRSRSTKTERCSFASHFTKGQVETSCFATNETGATADNTVMSSQDTWFETTRTPFWRASSPSTLMRTPTMRQTWR